MFMKFSYGAVLGMTVLILLLGFGSSASSDTNSTFNIAGCNFIFDGIPLSASAGECSGEPAVGYFFCGDDLVGYNTLVASHGCSMGSNTYTLGGDFCCPSGTFCNQTVYDSSNPDNNKFECDMRLENCADQNTSASCVAVGCIWMDITSECVENPRNYDCGYYDNSADCLTDEWNIGTSGVGTNFCGTTIECNGEEFTIPEDNCGCEWYPSAPEGDKCQLKMSVTQFFSNGNPDAFECSNVYDLGNCTNGTQDVTWYSNSSVINGFDAGIPSECLDALNCNGGELVRFCGEPVIKLPGFSLFSLVASFFIIGFYYFLMGKFKYKKDYSLS